VKFVHKKNYQFDLGVFFVTFCERICVPSMVHALGF